MSDPWSERKTSLAETGAAELATKNAGANLVDEVGEKSEMFLG